MVAHWGAFRVLGVKLLGPAPCVGPSTGFEPIFGVALAVRGVETLVASVEADSDEYGDKEEDGGEGSYSDHDACAKLMRLGLGLDRVGSGGVALRCVVEG